MSWKDKKLTASFRGVKFFVASGDRGGGRNTAQHVYPGSEVAPFHDDMGLTPREFSVDGYVLGADYETSRDALVKVLETPGAGELNHPYFSGPRRCVVKNFTVRQSTDDGGVARFNISFGETILEPKPSASISGKDAVAVAAVSANMGVKAQFLAKFKKAALLKASVTTAMRNAGTTVSGIVDTVSLPEQAAASLSSQIASINEEAENLTSAPDNLSAAVFKLVDTLGEGLDGLATPSTIMRRVAAFDTGDRPPATTSPREEEQNNFDATTAIIQRAAMVKAAVLLVEETFPSFDEAVAARAALVEDFEAHLESTNTDDVAFVALTNLRTALVAAVPGDDSDLPRLLEYTPTILTNSLVLSQKLYGNLDGELDLVARNYIRHPGFILPGVTLEVLSS